MKKIIAIFILSFMLLGLFVSCTPKENVEGGENQGAENGGENGTENGGTEDGGSEEGGNENGGESQDPPADNDPTDDPNEGGDNEDDPTEKPEVGTEVGNLFGDVSLETLAGGTLNTADYRGKILIVNIWATWCGPCTIELPNFNQIASDYADDVVIIAAHTPSGKNKAPAFVEESFSDSKIIFAYDSLNEAFLAAGGTDAVPQTAIIDQNGVIIYKHTGIMTYEQLAEIINEHK